MTNPRAGVPLASIIQQISAGYFEQPASHPRELPPGASYQQPAIHPAAGPVILF